MAEDRMLSDEILLGLIKKNGGSGGTTDYEALENLPEINGVELKGNMSLSDLGIASAQSVSDITNGESINNFAGVETALGNKQGKLTAGDYIDITNDEISVNREIPSVIAEYEIKTEPMVEGQAFISVTKTVNGEVVLTQKYGSSTAGINQGINFDENIYVDYSKTASWSWTYKLRNASVDHAANYTQSWNYGSTVDYTEEFIVTDHSGDKLVIKSEMDTAMAEKADTDMVAADFDATVSYTAGNYCVQDGKLYKFKNNHSGAWSSADVDEVKITGELSALKSGLTSVDNLNHINISFNATTMQDYLRQVIDTVNNEYPVGTTINIYGAWLGVCMFIMQASRTSSNQTIVSAIPQPGAFAVNKMWIGMNEDSTYTYSTIDMAVVN